MREMPFTAAERLLIDAAFEAAEADLLAAGLWPGRRGVVHLLHHRSVVRKIRGRDGGKLTHAEIAGKALGYARGRNDVTLYATMAIAAAVAAKWGPEGAGRARAAHPALTAGTEAFADFLALAEAPGPRAPVSRARAAGTGEA